MSYSLRNPKNRHYCYWCHRKQYEENMTTFFDCRKSHFVYHPYSDCFKQHALEIIGGLERLMSTGVDKYPFKN